MIVCKHSDLEWGGNETGKKHVKQFVVILLGFPIMNLIQSNNIKDAGFVYESLRNETNQVILKKNFHETNPRNESFKKISTNPNHDTGNL